MYAPFGVPAGAASQRFDLDEAAQDAAGFAAQRAAERDRGAECRCHAGDPEALSACMQVDRRADGPGLDGDRSCRPATSQTAIGAPLRYAPAPALAT